MEEMPNYLNVQLLGLGFGIFLIGTMIFMVKRRRIQEKYSLVWIFIGVLVTIFSINRGLLEKFSSLMGIDYAPSALFAILIVSSYILMLSMSISISGLKRKTKVLIQEVGLLKLQIEEMEAKISDIEKVN